MSDGKCARMLLDAAGRDADALRGMCESSGFSDEIFGFHVQQAAKKAFKAWLALLGETYPLTHNLESLLDRLTACGAMTRPFRALVGYTPYAVQFRYEGVNPDTAPIDRQDALALVEALLEQVRRRSAGSLVA